MDGATDRGSKENILCVCVFGALTREKEMGQCERDTHVIDRKKRVGSPGRSHTEK